MTRTLTEPLQSFRKVFDGELITSAEQATYDTVRALWNTEIDRRPAVIARCVNRSDVVAAGTSPASRNWRSRCAAGLTTRRVPLPVTTG